MPLLDAVIDTGLLSEVTTVITTLCSTLFSTYPLNVFVIMGIASGAIVLIRKGKKAAR